MEIVIDASSVAVDVTNVNMTKRSETMPETCYCGHVRDEHERNTGLCTVEMEILTEQGTYEIGGLCRCVAFDEAKDDEEKRDDG